MSFFKSPVGQEPVAVGVLLEVKTVVQHFGTQNIFDNLWQIGHTIERFLHILMLTITSVTNATDFFSTFQQIGFQSKPSEGERSMTETGSGL